jgi:Tfp pilus assembly protein PilV
MKNRISSRGQRGSTLIIAMVFLLLFAALAASAMRSSMSNVQAISNMQWRNESVAAANDAIDRVLSSTDFATKTPTVAAQVYQVDINGDGVNDVKVDFPVVTIAGVAKAGPRCLRQRSVPPANLDPNVASDRGCFGSSSGDASGLGVESGTSGGAIAVDTTQSICADTQWVIPVRATDEVTHTSVDVAQGVSVRVFRSDAMNYCN